MTGELPQFLRQLIDSPPEAGEGVHNWLFRVARQLHAHLAAGEIINLLSNRVQSCGRQVSAKEIGEAVKNAIPCAWQATGHGAPAQIAMRWPTVNQEQREAIIRDGGGLADLWELSPVRLADDQIHSEDIVTSLFAGNPLLCCGRSSHEFDTRPREAWRGELSGLQFIVPSPMSALTGTTKAGRESKHALDNTGPRRFLIVEFDTGTTDEHAALLIHLAGYAPLVCAVHSGGKSLHGWFYVGSQPHNPGLLQLDVF